uniref:ZP domain-containing protein n=1 Tax=Steinernema glaseri TaxID=37863 RepID=A0A1I7YMQ7_9BILA
MSPFPVLTAFLLALALPWAAQATSLDNGVIGEPIVDCMMDRVKITFKTERPFTGRIFVKGMADKHQCVESFSSNSKTSVQFEMANGQCNMRRSRKVGPEQRGVEQSITVIVSFHDIFITKVDRAYRTTCFYMEADRVVTNRFDVSMLPTTDLIDTARMPTCTYTVRKDSIDGAVVKYARIGEPVFHVWRCDSDMFGMIVHSCFVDDGNGEDRKTIIDENGCSIDDSIVPELTYNHETNMAYSEVNVFKFADKVTTYFQCAISTCMISEGMCAGKTPPRCGVSRDVRLKKRQALAAEKNGTRKDDPFTMDISADKIFVLDLDDSAEGKAREAAQLEAVLLSAPQKVCFSQQTLSLLTVLMAFSSVVVAAAALGFWWRRGAWAPKTI